MQRLFVRIARSQRIQALAVFFVMSVLVANPYVQLPPQFDGAAAASDTPQCTPYTENFASFSAGDIVTSGTGYSVSVDSFGDHDTLMIFDTLNPTGNDADLTTKDGDRFHPTNTQERGNALIISKDNDQSDPDDDNAGGIITFVFDEPVNMGSIGFLDIEEENGQIRLYDESDTELNRFDIAAVGNNSYQTIALNTDNVKTMRIGLAGSGAIPEISWCVPEVEEPYCEIEITKSDDGYDPAQVGSDITYHLQLKNVGTGDCTGGGVKLRDKYPSDQLAYVSYTLGDDAYPYEGDRFTHSGNELTWNFGTVEPADIDQWNGVRDVYVTFTVKEDVLCTETITNKLKSYSAETDWSEFITEDTALECVEPEVAAIAGCKYEDVNNNGVIDSGEQKLAGWTIELSENGSVIDTQVTGQNGCYIFEDVPFGTYTLSEQQQSGWIQTYPGNDTHTVVLDSAQTYGAIDFANYEEPEITTYCGDGEVQMPNDNGLVEQCDAGAQNGVACNPNYGDSCSYCSNTCEPITVDGPFCGDGTLQESEGEQCDDGNNDNGDGCSAQCTIEQTTCELDLTKVVDKSTAGLGDALTYTMQVENTGDAACTDVVLTDTIPSGISVSNSTPAPTSGANIWEVGTLQPGETKTITLNAEVRDDNNLCDSTITNSVVYTSNETGEGDPATADTTIECEPPSGECRLELEKTDATDPIQPGQNLEYTLTLTNTGDASCTNVQLEEDYDDRTTYVSATPAPDMTDTWVVGSLLPGESYSVAITVAVDDNEQLCESQLINTAYHDSSQTTRVSVSETTGVFCESEPVYDIALEKTVNDSTVKPNEDVLFTLTVTNQGATDMTNIEVTEYLPDALQFVSATPAQGSFDDQTMIWTVGDLLAGSSTTLDLVATVTGEGTFTNYAEVTSHDQSDQDSTPDNGTDNGEDDTDSAAVTADTGGGGCVTGCGGGGVVTPRITLVKSAAVQFTNPNTVVEYTLTITNTGNATGNDLIVTDNLPSPLTYVSSTLTGVWNLGSIAAGETKTITYDVQFPENISAGDYENIATAEISNGNSDEDDAIVEVRRTTVQGEEFEPLLSIDKSVDRSFTNPGGEAVYTVVVTNITTNNVTARNVILSDRLPDIFTFDTGANVKGWELGDLAPGQSATVSYTVQVSEKAINGTYENIASATADNAPTVYDRVPLEVRQVTIGGYVLPDTNGGEMLFLSITAGGLLILLAWMIRKYRSLQYASLA